MCIDNTYKITLREKVRNEQENEFNIESNHFHDKKNIYTYENIPREEVRWDENSTTSEGSETLFQNSWEGPVVFCLDEDYGNKRYLESRDMEGAIHGKKVYEKLCDRCMKEISENNTSKVESNVEDEVIIQSTNNNTSDGKFGDKSKISWKWRFFQKLNSIRVKPVDISAKKFNVKRTVYKENPFKNISEKFKSFKASLINYSSSKKLRYSSFSEERRNKAMIVFRKIYYYRA